MPTNKRWTATNVRAYLVFQPMPDCFDATQWVEWKHYAKEATNGVGDNGGIGPPELPPHCSDCTRAYQSHMRQAGRCSHPEVKFLANRAYIDPATLAD